MTARPGNAQTLVSLAFSLERKGTLRSSNDHLPVDSFRNSFYLPTVHVGPFSSLSPKRGPRVSRPADRKGQAYLRDTAGHQQSLQLSNVLSPISIFPFVFASFQHAFRNFQGTYGERPRVLFLILRLVVRVLEVSICPINQRGGRVCDRICETRSFLWMTKPRVFLLTDQRTDYHARSKANRGSFEISIRWCFQ